MSARFPARFDAFVAPARHRPALWRLALGSGLIVAVSLLWGLLVGFAAFFVLDPDRGAAVAAEMTAPTRAISTLLLLSSFVGVALGPAIAVRLLHRRSVASLFGPPPRFLRDAAFAAGLVLVLYLGSLFFYVQEFEPVPNLDPAVWRALLPLALILVLIQTGAEEMIFRGYLMQQIAARIPWRLAYMVVPSLIFGALHFDPANAGGASWLVAASAALFGLAAADLTRVTGSLGAAWGLHFANNVYALLILATTGTITGLGLFRTPYGIKEMELTPGLIAMDVLSLAVLWGVLRWRLAR